MNNRQFVALTLLGLVIGSTGCVSITEREVYGRKIAVLKTRDLCAPSTTTVLDENLQPITEAANPGLIPSTAGGAGIAAAGYFLGRQRVKSENSSNVRVGGDNVNATGGNGNGGTGGVGNGGTGGQFVPPGHVNNPSQNN